MKRLTTCLTICLLIGSILLAAETNKTLSVITSQGGPDANDRQRLIHDDNEFRFVSVNYGNRGNQVPGLYVFSKQHTAWLRVTKVTTKDAILGRSPTFEEARKAGASIASVDWNFRSLKDQDFVRMPIQGGSFLAFPDKITFDERKQIYVLSFHHGWKIDGVETIFRINRADLVAAFTERDPNT
jgi:hypothetical protein